MSTAQQHSFTPGPWHYRRGDEWSHSVVTHHGLLPDGSMSCWTVASINKAREPEHEANARLISSAPDLLNALKGLLASVQRGVCDGSGMEQDAAREAIAKAVQS